jgi:hypothetical protein
LRWQRLARHASALGWQLDVITVDPASLRKPDSSRLDELPAGTRVYGVPATPLRIDRWEKAVWLAARRFWPRRRQAADGTAAHRSGRPQSLGREETLELRWTPRVLVRTYYAYLLHVRHRRWAEQARALASTLIEPRVSRAIITCGPPHEVHSAGSAVARRARLPHVMDMRDPWSLAERLPEIVATPFIYRNAASREKKVVRHAALIVCNTEPARSAYQRLYPEAKDRCIAVMNGYDEETLPATKNGERFTVAYAGSIYLDRTPRELFRAASRVIRERRLTPEAFAIEFMGQEEMSSGPTLKELAQQEGVGDFVRVRPPASRKEAMEFLADATVLVSLPQDSGMAIPSKVFEYMRFDAWLLALADPGSATQLVLAGSGADVVAPRDVNAIAAVLGNRYEQFTREGRPRQPAVLPSCSRAAQARILFDALDRVVSEHKA